MNRPTQSPRDKVLWILASLKGEVDRRELRIRSGLPLAELNAILTELEKAGKIRTMPKCTGWRDQDRTAIQLKRQGRNTADQLGAVFLPEG